MISRTIQSAILEFLQDKLVLLTGPRQVGKTFFSRSLAMSPTYLNFDESTHRKLISAKEWPRDSSLLILDELHKMKKWKTWLKGIYDTEGLKVPIIVTGSARMDTYRKDSDSLAGRHHLMHLLPLSVKEVDVTHSKEVFEQLLRFGGFPEPFLKANDRSAKLWRKSHLDVVLRQDLLDLEKVRELKSIEILVDLLADQVGSPISYSSLARTLEVSPNTVKHWIQILENLYVVFSIRPYSKNIRKSILKEPKLYFYDISRVTAPLSARYENLVAYHLLKRNLFLADTEGEDMELCYVRNKEHQEVDFLTVRNRRPEWLIETKESDDNISSHFKTFSAKIEPLKTIQLVHHLTQRRERSDHIVIAPAHQWLARLET